MTPGIGSFRLPQYHRCQRGRAAPRSRLPPATIRLSRNRIGMKSPAQTWVACRRLRSEEHTSELQSPAHLVCRLLLDKKKIILKISVFCISPLASRQLVPSVPYKSLHQTHATYTPDITCSVTELPSDCFFFVNDTATTEIYTLSLHDALPISRPPLGFRQLPPGVGGRGVSRVARMSD